MKQRVILIMLILGFVQTQAQGNYRIENFGNRSILLSGNVTGSVDDLGLTYYNPARLAQLEDPKIIISGKVFEQNSATLENAFGENTNLKSSNFRGVPSMVAGSFNLKSMPGHYFAYSFISRFRSQTNLNYNSGVQDFDILPSPGDFQSYNAQVSLKNSLKDEWVGLTWATKLTDNFSVGLSGFWSIYEFDGKSELLYAAIDADDRSVSYFNDVGYNQKTYGLFFKAGASWTHKNLNVGLNIHLPYINLWDKASFDYDEVLAGLDPEDDLFTFVSYDDLTNSRKTALGVSLGSGIKIGRSEVHVNVEWYNRIKSYRRISLPDMNGDVLDAFNINFNEELRPVVNFGLGGEIYLSPVITGFASFSSDFSAFKTNANLFDVINPYDDEINELTDYWHFALGVDLKFNWGDIILGSSFSRAGTSFAQPIAIPVGDINGNGDQVSDLKLRRTRFIIGIEIPLLREKIESVIKKELR